MVSIIVPDKRPNTANHTLQQEQQKATYGLQPVNGERDFTTDIHLPPESHFITGSPIKQDTGLQKPQFHSQIHNMALFLLADLMF